MYPNHEGNEVFIMGFDGSVRMICFEFPDISLKVQKDDLKILIGGEDELMAKIVSRGYAGDLDISADLSILEDGSYILVEPVGLNITFPQTMTVNSEGDFIDFVINADSDSEPGSYRLSVNASSLDDDSVKASCTFHFSTLRIEEPELTVLSMDTITYGDTIRITSEMKNTGTLTISSILVLVSVNHVNNKTVTFNGIPPSRIVKVDLNMTGIGGNNTIIMTVRGNGISVLNPEWITNEEIYPDEIQREEMFSIPIILAIVVGVTLIGILIIVFFMNLSKNVKESERKHAKTNTITHTRSSRPNTCSWQKRPEKR